MFTTQREPRTVALTGGLLAGAGLLWLLPRNFGFGTDFGFVGGAPLIPQFLASGAIGYFAHTAVLAAMIILAIGLPLDRPRQRQRVTQVFLIIFGGWGLLLSILMTVSPLHGTIFGPFLNTMHEIAYIAVAVAAAWFVIRERLIEGWERWLFLVLALAKSVMTPVMLLLMVLPAAMLNSVFASALFDLAPFGHLVVGGLLLAGGLISKNRLTAQLYAEGPDDPDAQRQS
ncbi:MAG TPA: hypothetical protein H9830_01395 [Candidatus Agrococcus pullicola]|uniref:DUF998 domain-containing protein n=1 Tax=Candidatus Agrococcus pullicola TaxID=2838429 RepID=A0A9D1YSC5_9MICO|nr:hypothetical protein [Candidatus Agrococcus pullicola]